MKITNKLILENSQNLNILYVEDEESLRNSTAELLNEYFKSVDVAVDGLEGLSKYRAYYEKANMPYDIVITDVVFAEI